MGYVLAFPSSGLGVWSFRIQGLGFKVEGEVLASLMSTLGEGQEGVKDLMVSMIITQFLNLNLNPKTCQNHQP